ncbi:hypothetical protein SSCG_05224 [Streptomyces clavuligerus]|nr:hypothetical protein SSCG_05224 [Streptomyces clavuligerus]
MVHGLSVRTDMTSGSAGCPASLTPAGRVHGPNGEKAGHERTERPVNRASMVRGAGECGNPPWTVSA